MPPVNFEILINIKGRQFANRSGCNIKRVGKEKLSCSYTCRGNKCTVARFNLRMNDFRAENAVKSLVIRLIHIEWQVFLHKIKQAHYCGLVHQEVNLFYQAAVTGY